jgi:hypothetical protein
MKVCGAHALVMFGGMVCGREITSCLYLNIYEARGFRRPPARSSQPASQASEQLRYFGNGTLEFHTGSLLTAYRY